MGLLTSLRAILPACSPVFTSRESPERSTVDQASLRAADLDMLECAIAATPNTDALFPYDNFIQMVAAIKAATVDDPERGYDAFEGWFFRYDGDPEGVTPQHARWAWDSVGDRFAIGADYVFSKAAQHGDFDRAAQWWSQQAYDDGQAEMVRLAAEKARLAAAAANALPWPAEQPDEVEILPPLRAGRLELADLQTIAPRQWLFGRKLLRRYVSFIASPGGVGKTAWITAVALSMAAGAALLHDRPHRPLRVWVRNLEDDLDEMRRRFAAALTHHELEPCVLDNVRLNSGRDRRFSIVALGPDGQSFVVQPDKATVVAEMRRLEIDVLVVDPFLRSHGLSENDNEAQDEVMRLYAEIAHEADAAVALLHHTKKGAVAGDPDSLRGGSTQSGSARVVLTLSPMSAAEAKAFGLDEARRRLFVRIDDAKGNMAPPANKADWMRLASVPLSNGNAEYPEGDNVQVATRWEPPTVEATLSAAPGGADAAEARILAEIQKGHSSGERYSIKPQATALYAGPMVMEVLSCSAEGAKAALTRLEKQGRIAMQDYRSVRQSKMKQGLVVLRPLVPDLADFG